MYHYSVLSREIETWCRCASREIFGATIKSPLVHWHGKFMVSCRKLESYDCHKLKESVSTIEKCGIKMKNDIQVHINTLEEIRMDMGTMREHSWHKWTWGDFSNNGASLRWCMGKLVEAPIKWGGFYCSLDPKAGKHYWKWGYT